MSDCNVATEVCCRQADRQTRWDLLAGLKRSQLHACCSRRLLRLANLHQLKLELVMLAPSHMHVLFTPMSIPAFSVYWLKTRHSLAPFAAMHVPALCVLKAHKQGCMQAGTQLVGTEDVHVHTHPAMASIVQHVSVASCLSALYHTTQHEKAIYWTPGTVMFLVMGCWMFKPCMR